MQFPWIKRTDLMAVPHDAGGWVIKDPLTLRYAFLNDTEYAILNLLDGSRTVTALLRQVSRLRPGHPVTPDDLSQFIRSLAGHQLIRQTAAGDSARLKPGQHRPAWLRAAQPLFRVLRFQLPLFNPTRLLDATLPILRQVLTQNVRRCLSLVAVLALLVVGLRFQELADALPSLPQFLGPENMLLMLAIFVVVKLLHEAGHACTARHFGAECNECGIMLMVLTPVLYTNVSDSWMLPRRQRMLVTAAGILVELTLAAVCLLLWTIAAPGNTRTLLLNTVVLCSLNTVLFNGNPLLRFDGYFLLADALRIPNLASRASEVLQHLVLRIVTGNRHSDHENGRTWIILLVYGILSAAYRVLLTLAILQLVDQVTTQWNVRFVGQFLTITILTGFLVLPAIRFLKAVWAADEMDHSAAAHPARPLVVAGLLAGLLLIPLPQSVVVPAFVQPTAVPLYASLPGQLQSTRLYGATLQVGEPVVTLKNPELELNEQRLTARVQDLQLQLDALTRNPATAGSEQIPSLKESLKAALEQQESFSAESADLVLQSPVNGTFLPPPTVPRNEDPDLPEFWHGSLAQPSNIGAWISRGTLLGYVGQPTDVVLLACVPEEQLEFLRSNQTARFLADGAGSTTVTGTVSKVSTVVARRLPRAVGLAGLVNGRVTADGVEPLQPTWLVTVRLTRTSESATIPLYSVGRVRIATEPASLWRRLNRFLRQTF